MRGTHFVGMCTAQRATLGSAACARHRRPESGEEEGKGRIGLRPSGSDRSAAARPECEGKAPGAAWAMSHWAADGREEKKEPVRKRENSSRNRRASECRFSAPCRLETRIIGRDGQSTLRTHRAAHRFALLDGCQRTASEVLTDETCAKTKLQFFGHV